MTSSDTDSADPGPVGVGDVVVEPPELLTPDLSMAEELRAGWPLLVSAMFGSGLSAILAYALGVFIAPIGRDYGWTPEFVILGFTVSTLLGAIGALFCGKLIDRFGSRRLALSGTVLLAGATAGLGLIPRSGFAYIACYVCVAAAHTILSPIVWQKLVVEKFETARGLAVSIVLCGPNIAGAISPVLGNFVIERANWHIAYLVLALYILASSLPLTWLFFRESPRDSSRSAVRGAGIGKSMHEVVRTREFWLLCLSFAIAAVGIGGYTVHLVPILRARDLSPMLAASMVSALSLAALSGRLMAGFAMDRLFAPRIATAALSLPVVSSLLLLFLPPTHGTILIASLLIGFASGAEYNMLGYLTARYFGLRSFGTVGSILFSLFTMGCLVGQQLPAVIGHSSYDMVITLFGGCYLTGAIIMLFCRRYPEPNT